mmetsp:Transcript_25561/g.35156  ORF Transcript_25561/g.35156 Transcript_25561/m.35156 type:complete len:107 (+) Transcript_25561:1388-1708(+)
MSKRKAEAIEVKKDSKLPAISPEIVASINLFLTSNGLKSAAAALAKDVNINTKNVSATPLEVVFDQFLKSKKIKTESGASAKAPSSDSDDSDSDSSEDSEKKGARF